MSRVRKLVLAGTLVLALSGLTAGIALATGGDGGSEEPALSGSALEKASAAALAHTGGGTITDTETGDGGAAFGVEIRLDDGREVEVSLDENFKVVGEETDDDWPNGDNDGPNDD